MKFCNANFSRITVPTRANCLAVTSQKYGQTSAWRLSMHGRTYVYGDEQRDSVLPMSHKNELP